MRFRRPRVSSPSTASGRLGSGILMTSALALVAGLLVAAPAGVAAAAGSGSYSRNCSLTPSSGQMACMGLRRTDITQPSGVLSSGVSPGATPAGFGPASLRSAYNLPTGTAGTGMTVAVVNAYHDPSAESDLAVYRTQFGLPACTTANGCFKVVNQAGLSSPLPNRTNTNWAGEASVATQMISAACPNCKILLVEADLPSNSSLLTGVDAAARLGATAISIGWGSPEYSAQTGDEHAFNHPGVAIAAAAGNVGNQATYPATSRYTTAVGGTHLTLSSSSRGWAETAWSSSGSGCSDYDAKPSWQVSTDTGCTMRAAADVSAVADPASGVTVFQSTGSVKGWQVYGGTSVSAPIVAASYALAGTPVTGSYPAAYPYAKSSSLFDVVGGSNGSCGPPVCASEAGWDGATGLGTPNGSAAFFSTAPPTSVNTVTVATPDAQTATYGVAFKLTLKATDSDPAQTLKWTATGLPDGLSIDQTSGTITGAPASAGSFSSTVTATDTAGAVGSATFSTQVSKAKNVVKLTVPDTASGVVGGLFSLLVKATDSDPSEILGFTATGLPDGLSIDKPTGLISGTPTSDGTSAVTVTATDSTGISDSASFTTKIRLPNVVKVSTPDDQTGVVGTAFSLQIRATDSDPDETLSYAATGLPDGLTIAADTGLISGTPTSDGPSTIKVTATDSTGVSDSATFTAKVRLPNAVKISTPDDQTGVVGAAFSLQIEATDSDPGETLTYRASGLPDGVSIDSDTGLISGTPTTDGSSTVKVTATDSTGISDAASFALQVRLPNVVKVSTPDDQKGVVGTALSLQIRATDSDPDETLTFSATGLPDGLSIDKATGLISGTPTSDGSSTVTVTVTDSTGISDTASFALQVRLPNVVKVTAPDPQTATAQTAFSLQITATDSDPGETLSYAATGLPDGLTIDAGSGLISGTPAIDGTSTIKVSATDSTGISDTASFALKTNPACTPAQVVGNPGFENLLPAPWTPLASTIADALKIIHLANGNVVPHDGKYFAWLNGLGLINTQSVSQTITVPAPCTKTTLSFWLEVNSSETSTTTAYDKLTVKVGSDTLATYSNLDKGSQYVQKTFSLAAYAGQTVTITFSGTEDASLKTSFLLDDVAVNTLGPTSAGN